MARTALLLENAEELKKIIEDSVRTAIINLLPSITKNNEREPDYLNIVETAKLLKLSKQTVYQNINTIPHYKYNGRLLFKKSELVAYIESNGNTKNS